MLRICLIAFVLTLPVWTATAQERRNTLNQRENPSEMHQENPGPGELRIYQDRRIDDLINRHVQGNLEKKGLDGYRIQIYFGSGAQGRQEANEHNARALSYFPDLKVHLLYQHSYYKVRLGNFRTRTEAYFWHQKIKRRFPNAYIVPDIIEFPVIDTR